MTRPARERARSWGAAAAAAMAVVLAAGAAGAEEGAAGAEEGAAPAELTLIRVSSEPSGAVVVIDGHPCGLTPALVEVGPGSHEVTVGSGASHMISTVVAVEGETVEVGVVLAGGAPPSAPRRPEPGVQQRDDEEGPAPPAEEAEERPDERERPTPRGPWHSRVPRWPWVEVEVTAGALWRDFRMPIDPSVDTSYRSEARLQTAGLGMGYLAGRIGLFPFAASRTAVLRGLGIEAGGGGVVDLVITSPVGGTVEASCYEVDLGALYRLSLGGEDVGVAIETRLGWHRTAFDMSDVNNDLIPPFEYDSVRISAGLVVPLGTRHLAVEASGGYLAVVSPGSEAVAAYNGSGMVPVVNGGEVGIGLVGRLGGLELGLRWRGRWMVGEHEGVGRGYGFEPSTVVGLGGDGIRSTGASVDAYQAVLVDLGYRFGPDAVSARESRGGAMRGPRSRDRL